MKINRGSEWRKWDLHVHTKNTNKNDQFTSKSLDEYFIYLFKKAYQENIACIGITDYFTIDRYLDALKFIDEIQSKVDDQDNPIFSDEEKEFIENIFLLPNIELRMLPTTDKSRLINIHCLINPDYVPKLNNALFNTLENEGRFKMNHAGFIDYAKSLGQTGDDNKLFKEGLNRYTIDPKTLKEVIDKNLELKDNILIIVSNSNNDGNSGLQKHYDLFENETGSLDGIRKNIYKLSQAIFSNQEKDTQYFLGKRLDNKKDITFEEKYNERKRVIEEQGHLKACIVGCDAHTETDIFSRFTWIKSHLTFEGLKQILHEPEQRVIIQENIPNEKDKKLIISQASFVSSNNLFTPKIIYFNDNLNVIIGGKSSGKSILLYNIAKALYKDRSDEGVLKYFDTTDNRFKYFYDDLQNESDFIVKVKLASGLEQSSDRDNTEPSILPEIKYIPQNHLSNLVDRSKKNGSTLKELIKELILEDPFANERYKLFEDNRDSNNSEKLREIDTFFDFQDKIKGLKKDIQDKGSKDILTTSITFRQNEIITLQKDISEENKNLYNTYNTEIQILINENEKIISDYRKLKTLNQNIKASLEKIQNDKNSLLNTLENIDIKSEFTEQYGFIQQAINKINEIEQLFLLDDNNLINESSIKKQLINNNKIKRELQEKIKPLLGQKESQDKIQLLQTEIRTDQEKLNSIIKIENEIKDLQNELIIQKEKIFNNIEINFNEYQSLVHDLEPRTQDIENKDNDQIDIKGSTKFNFKKFKESMNSISDLRTLRFQNPFNYLYNENLNNLSEINKDDIISELKNVFDSILEENYPLIKDFSLKEACRILLENHFFDHWEVKSGNDTIHNMSTGKASFILLKLIIKLSKSEAPILIDQPEDNLDNRSISTDLVDYLKDKKLKRQIILVTHNANIVVNADAENIIVANQKDENNTKDKCIYTFDYINGALEETNYNPDGNFLKSMSIRQHIADILEGGKEAFKKREEKYGF